MTLFALKIAVIDRFIPENGDIDVQRRVKVSIGLTFASKKPTLLDIQAIECVFSLLKQISDIEFYH